METDLFRIVGKTSLTKTIIHTKTEDQGDTNFCWLMKNLNEKLESSVDEEYYHAVTLKRSVLGDDSVTITLSDSRPEMNDTTMEIPFMELSSYDTGKSVLFEVGYWRKREEWSLGDNKCYYLIFN